jgi:hypothetical protein
VCACMQLGGGCQLYWPAVIELLIMGAYEGGTVCVCACDWVEGVEQEVVQLQRDLWLAEYRHRQAQRDLERVQSCGGNKDQATWEYKN